MAIKSNVRVHDLKTDPAVFKDSDDRKQLFQIRKNDRDFKVGDILRLHETQHTGEEMKKGAPLIYTRRSLAVSVIHIMQGPIYGLTDGWVIMSVK